MPPTINLKRPDGTYLNATPEQAKRLALLGYKEEGQDEKLERIRAEERERYYTTGTEQAKTAAEGFLSGATVGGSDFIFDGDHSKGRAEYNPGIRVATQVAGAIAPALITGGTSGAVAAVTPAGALARGASVAAKVAAPGSRVARSAVAAGIEGGVSAAGSEAGRAHLAGDPITAESVIAAAGWGTILGAGIGAGAAQFGKSAEKLGKTIELEKAARADDVLIETAEKAPVLSREAYRPFSMAMDDVVRAGDRAARTVDDAVAKASKLAQSESVAAAKAAKAEAKVMDDLVRKAQSDGVKNLHSHNPELRSARNAVQRVYKAAGRAAEGGDPEKLKAALTEYREILESANQKAGFSFDTSKLRMPTPIPVDPIEAAARKAAADDSAKALGEVTQLKSSLFELKKFPRTEKDFLAMTPSKAERVFAAYDQVMSGAGGSELDAFRQALTEGVYGMLTSVGIASESGAGGLRKAWETLRRANVDVQAAKTRQLIRAANGIEKKQHLGILGRILRQASARGASNIARGAGGGAFASSAAYQGAAFGVGSLIAGPAGALGLVAEVSGIRGAVQNSLRQAVAKFGPGAARGVRRAAPQVGGLATRLTGEPDEEKGSATQLFHRRSEEIRHALPAARDTLFQAVAPLHDAGESDFAAALHESASKMLESLMEFLPRDPGDTFSAGRSQWDPDEIEVERFAKVYEVFQNPINVVQTTLSSGEITPDQSKALKAFYPGLYMDLQVEMMQRVSDPEFAKSLSYDDQADLSILLDLDLHSTFRSDWIKEQQEMYLKANAEPTPQPSASSGRPAGPPSPLTEGQQMTAR